MALSSRTTVTEMHGSPTSPGPGTGLSLGMRTQRKCGSSSGDTSTHLDVLAKLDLRVDRAPKMHSLASLPEWYDAK